MKPILLALGFLAACASPPTSDPGLTLDGVQLVGTSWTVNDPDIPQGLPHPTLSFGTERASGFAGCNQWFAQINAAPERGLYRFGPVGSTRRACPPPQMAVERDFFAKLARVRSLALSPDHGALYLIGDEADQIARLDAAPPARGD